jgi:uncharacterized metal-binding protein YceD (DUF177 family)
LEVPEVPETDVFDVQIQAYSLGREKLVQGALEGTMHLACTRCQDGFAHPVSIEFRHCYVPGAPGESYDSPDDGDYFFSPGGDFLDLTTALREEVLLQLPMNPSPPQKEDGTCSHCGKSETQVLGKFQDTDGDPRLAVLKSLLQSTEEDKKA